MKLKAFEAYTAIQCIGFVISRFCGSDSERHAFAKLSSGLCFNIIKLFAEHYSAASPTWVWAPHKV